MHFGLRMRNENELLNIFMELDMLKTKSTLF